MTTFAIGSDGEMYNCQHELGQKEFIIGNVRKGLGITENLVDEHCTDISKQCENCIYLPVCQGGCYYAMRAGNTEAHCQVIKFECSIRTKMLLDYLTWMVKKGGSS